VLRWADRAPKARQSLGSFKRSDQLRLLPANPHGIRHKIARFRPFTFPPTFLTASSALCNGKIMPSEYLLEDFMNNAS
jgi:hypothetical protein